MTTIWAGLSVGAIYAIVAVTFNLGLMVSGVFNFAQPQFVMRAAFLAYVAAVVLELPGVVVVLVVIPAVILAGVLQEYLTIRPIPSGRQHSAALVTTVGASFAMSSAAIAIWGSLPLAVPFGQSNVTLSLLGGAVQPVDLMLMVLAVVVAIGLDLVSNRTAWGVASLAVAEDRDTASIQGVNPRRVIVIATVVAATISAVLALVSVSKTFAIYNLGDDYTIKAFVALAIGGFGSYRGALVGGLAVGLIEASAARWLGTQFSDVSIFAVLLVVLLVRPVGAFGSSELRRL
jgi:branched-chain amino acid transport system permease protein